MLPEGLLLRFAQTRRFAMLITFEGLDGSGKTTQAQLLEARLHGLGVQTLLVREPGGTALSERVRGLLLDASLSIAPFSELLLFAAARAQLVREVIRPRLEAGYTVLCDRFYDSTTAYQGFGRAVVDPAWLTGLNRQATNGLVPDRTYLIDVPPALALARRAARVQAAVPVEDRMEASGEAFYARVARGYARIAEAEPGRVVRLDGRDPVAVLEEAIWQDARRLLGPKAGTGAT